MPSSFVRSPVFAPVLVVLLSLMVAALAYQSPVGGTIPIGWIGDQLFLRSSAALGHAAVERGDWYADALTDDAPTGRSRWTRQHALLTLPHLGGGFDTTVTLLVQGWPADVVGAATTQPTVTVRADGVAVGSFIPTTEWEEYRVTVPASVRRGDHLVLETETSAVFTDTLRGADPRPKGIRLAGLEVRGHAPGEPLPTSATFGEQVRTLLAQVQAPAWGAVLLLVVDALLLYLLLYALSRSPALSFVITAVGVGAAGAGLALLRLWMGAALVVALWVLVAALLLAWHRALLALVRGVVWRYTMGHTLNYGLVVAALCWLFFALEGGMDYLRDYVTNTQVLRLMFPDTLLLEGLLLAGCTLLLLLGREGLPGVTSAFARGLARPRPSLVLLLLFGGIWLGYETLVVYRLPYVGHADYADNAVVARNLLAGRGWVVDYVTQFYQLYDGVTRPQETWPLLQPVWIAPFLALFGEHAWAAKVPNLLFNVVLLLLIYGVGTHLWDRRVGLTAALLTLTNHLFFKLTIYTTSDLAFVVFSVAALYLLYCAHTARAAPVSASNASTGGGISSQSPALLLPVVQPRDSTVIDRRTLVQLVGAGVFTGLMMLQKPGSAIIAVGMGVWLLMQGGQSQWQARASEPDIGAMAARVWAWFRRRMWYAVLWSLPAFLLLAPYIIRNQMLFGAPVYSTESYDAWVLGYRGDSGDAWSDIYRVYVPELGGQGLPDRSWILRWGFDLTLGKLQTQVEAVRDYLMPAWSGLTQTPAGEPATPPLLSQNERKNLLSPVGAWLAFLGVVAALRYRRRLLALLTMAFGPYTLFLVTYWHANEERYFLMAIPWLLLLAAWVVWAGYDRLAAIGRRIWSPLALLLVVLALFNIVQFSWPIIAKKVRVEPELWQPDLVAYEWLRENTPPDAVVMTRNPWQLNWHAQRPSLMIPNTADHDMLFFLGNYYDAQYIVFDSIQRVKGDAAAILAPLINPGPAQVGDTMSFTTESGGRYTLTLVYASPTVDHRVLIYRFPQQEERSGARERGLY